MAENTSSPIEPLRLTPDILQPAIILGVSIALLALGVFIVIQGNYQALFLVVLFTLAIIASLYSILPGSCYIQVDSVGIKTVSRFRETIYLWSQIERIGIFEIGIVKRIGIDLNKTYAGPERVPEYMKSASGYHVTIPLMTGLELEELYAFLVKCHAVSTGTTPSDDSDENLNSE